MRGAALGNMLQGWDNATIASSLLYIKREFGLDAHPALEFVRELQAPAASGAQPQLAAREVCRGCTRGLCVAPARWPC